MTPDIETDCCSPGPQNAPRKSDALCPSCWQKGKPVKPVTIESLVTTEARARVGEVSSFRFCARRGCVVAYYDPDSGEQILADEVRVAIGQKETVPERTVCYCFHHTAAEVEAEVAATGSSGIPDEIGARCKQGLDRCEEMNPQGSCCLGSVRQFLSDVQGRAGASTPAVVPAGTTTSAAAAGCCSVDSAPQVVDRSRA